MSPLLLPGDVREYLPKAARGLTDAFLTDLIQETEALLIMAVGALDPGDAALRGIERDLVVSRAMIKAYSANSREDHPLARAMNADAKSRLKSYVEYVQGQRSGAPGTDESEGSSAAVGNIDPEPLWGLSDFNLRPTGRRWYGA